MTERDGTRRDTGPYGRTPLSTYIAVAAITTAVGFGAVYAMKPAADKSAAPASASKPAAAKPDVAKPDITKSAAATSMPTGREAMATGEMLTFVFKKTPEPIADFTFEDGTGAKKTLADWNGKVVLLNLWATWCAPCRHEMPSLDRLQKRLGGPENGRGFEVVALSVDRQGAAASKKFLDDTKIEKLGLYVESTSKSLGTLKATGLPTTILIDRDGREIGRLAGPAEWDSPDAIRLIEGVLK
ncbi:MAG: TlpA family protein disulfide reductase [Hyphomicrobiaceae bacterium]|nr:TlpA family protein disulfide reductase [Hyphomicrobiaceae bacterium]